MRARLLNEKFTEDSDAIRDMGIGEPEYARTQEAYHNLEKYLDFDIEDLKFENVINDLDQLRKITAYTVSLFFNTHYDFYVHILPDVGNGHETFAETKVDGWNLKFRKSGSGRSIYIQFWKKGAFLGNSSASRSIRALNNNFLYKCKKYGLEIDKHKKEA